MIREIYRKIPFLALGIILVVTLAFMLNASRNDSAIMDELAHIPAGYGYVKYLDYRLNPEHPPLLKALSALPLLGLDLNFPTDHKSWTQDINGQWEAGNEFLYESGNDAQKIVFYARLFPIILTLLTILLIYIWSKELLGRWWALLPAFLFGLSPTVLAHGHYVTTDLAATFGLLISSYTFLKFILHPKKLNLILAGLAFGVAQLAKFSLVLIAPYFIILIVVFWAAQKIRERRSLVSETQIQPASKSFWHYLGSTILIFIIGYILVYLVYFLFTADYPQDKQLSDASFILNSFSPKWLAGIDIWMMKSKILRPLGEYFLGFLMVLQRSAGGNTGYFLGEVSATGSWYYFPVVFLLKEPLPSLILMIFALVLAFRKIIKNARGQMPKSKRFVDYLGTHFPEFSMLAFIIIYWVYSMRSPLNIGLRHLLPTIPFIYILTAGALKSWFNANASYNGFIAMIFQRIRNLLRGSFKFGLILILLIWYFFETALASPYFLSYFNEFGGDIKSGYRYVVDSNYDWGQDLKRLQQFVQKNNIQKIAVDYFGGGNPKYLLGENAAENWWSGRGNPKDIGIEWLAVSVNTLQGAFGKLHPGQQRNPEDEYKWLKDLRPPQPSLGNVPASDFRAGTSIFIYHL